MAADGMRLRRVFGLLLLTVLAAGCGGGETREARNMTREQVASEQASVRINPGEWERTSEIVNVQAPSMPREMMQAMQGRRTQVRHCVTPEQAADPSAFGRRMQQQDGSCEVQDFTMRNGRMEGETLCWGGTPQEVRSRMSGQFGPDGFDYRSTVSTPAPMAGGTMNLEVRVQGRRIGECPAGGEAKQ